MACARVMLGQVAMALWVVSSFKVSHSSQVIAPALFVFGDSLADSGNNNHLLTLAKANFPPYGINFPGGVASGRFANGYTSIDYLAFKLGLPLVPVYEDSSTQGSKLLQGVNFASAGSGIESYTGITFGKVITLDNQIKAFDQGVKQEIINLIGAEAGNALITKAVFYIVTGSNDWLNTYFLRGSPLQKLYTVSQYTDMLVAKLLSQVEAIYNAGARKIGVAGLGALGCCPSQLRAYKSNGSCVGFLNKIASDFNEKLRPQLLDLTNKLPNSTILYSDLYTPLINAVKDPSSFGLIVTNQACCGIGKFGGFLNCFQGFPVCKNVGDYLFWDSFHPTSKFDEKFVDLLWNQGPPYSYPRSGKQALS